MSSFEVEVSFHRTDKGPVLLASEAEINRLRQRITLQREDMEARRKEITFPEDAPPADSDEDSDESEKGAGQANKQKLAELDSVEKIIERAEKDLATFLAKHESLMESALKTVYTLKPYSYNDYLDSQDRFTKIDPQTSEPSINMDRLYADLLEKCLLEKDGQAMSKAEKRELSRPVAQRLWQALRDASEATEADFLSSTA